LRADWTRARQAHYVAWLVASALLVVAYSVEAVRLPDSRIVERHSKASAGEQPSVVAMRK
jgi:hypothetical protein